MIQSSPVLSTYRLPADLPRQTLSPPSELSSQFMSSVGVVGAVLGLAAAMAFFPSNPYGEVALRWSGLSMMVGLSFVPVYCAFKNFRSFFRAENLVMIGLIYMLLTDVLQGHYPLRQVTVEGLRWTFVLIGLFVFFFWFSNLAPPFQLPKFVRATLTLKFDADRLFKIALVFFCIAILNYLWASDFDPIRMFTYLLANRWYAPWVRGSLGGWNAFLDHLPYFGYALPLLAVAIGTQRGWLDGKTILVVLLAIIFELFLMHSGNRRIVGGTLGAALLYWNLTRPRGSVRQAVVNVVAVLFILAALQFMIQVRSRGLIFFMYYGEEIELKTDAVRVDDNFLRLAQIIDIIPARHDYVYWNRFLYTLARPIPRVFWPDKPINPGFVLTEHIYLGGSATLTASVLSDWYMSFGLIGVAFGGVFYGRLTSMWSRIHPYRTSSAMLVYCLGCMAIFVSLRSFDELVLFTYPLLAWVAYITVFGGKKETTHELAPA